MFWICVFRGVVLPPHHDIEHLVSANWGIWQISILYSHHAHTILSSHLRILHIITKIYLFHLWFDNGPLQLLIFPFLQPHLKMITCPILSLNHYLFIKYNIIKSIPKADYLEKSHCNVRQFQFGSIWSFSAILSLFWAPSPMWTHPVTSQASSTPLFSKSKHTDTLLIPICNVNRNSAPHWSHTNVQLVRLVSESRLFCFFLNKI